MEKLFIGKNAFVGFMNDGTQIVPALFAVLLLWIVMIAKGERKPLKVIRSFVLLCGLLLFVLLCPGICGLVDQMNTTGDPACGFRAVPVAVILGAAMVYLWQAYVPNHNFRMKALFLAVYAGLILAGMTAPWRLTTDGLHMISNRIKVSKDAITLSELPEGTSVLVPQRLAAELGEIPANINYRSEEGMNVTDPASLLEAAITGGNEYVVMDKKVLSETALLSLDATMNAKYYECYRDEGRYIVYRKAENAWMMVEHADTTGS